MKTVFYLIEDCYNGCLEILLVLTYNASWSWTQLSFLLKNLLYSSDFRLYPEMLCVEILYSAFFSLVKFAFFVLVDGFPQETGDCFLGGSSGCSPDILSLAELL